MTVESMLYTVWTNAIDTALTGLSINANGETELKLNDKVIFMGQPKSLNLLASEFFKDKRKLKNVTIIGGGNVGQRLAQALESIGVKIKLFERNKKRCEQLSEILQSTLILNADGTNYELLKIFYLENFY